MKVFAARAGFLALLALLAAFCAGRIDFGTDITNFMPDGRSADLAVLARHLAHSDLARTMMLTVGTASGPRDEERIARAVLALKEGLTTSPEVGWLRSGTEDSDFEQVWKLYYPRRFGLVSLNPADDIPRLFTPEAIAKSATRARDSLASSTAAMTKRTLPGDPLGFSAAIIDRMGADNTSMQMRHGIFFTSDGYGVLLLGTRDSAFDARLQAPLLDRIDSLFAGIRAHEGGNLVLEKSGANRFAVDAERSMVGDMWWVGGAAMAGIALLVLVYFRSATRFFVTLIPSLGGIVIATALGLLIFGHLDGLTLAFGASLIGVAIDYPIYLLNHLTLLGGTRRAVIARIWPTLASGALTTVAGFAGLALTAFPGFREIGFFAAAGVGSALLVTLFVVPVFLDEHVEPLRMPGVTARMLSASVNWSLRHRRMLAVIPLAVVVLGAVMLPRLKWQDDLSKLSNVDPRLESEERRVQDRVASFEAGRVALVIAASEEEALQRTEQIARAMARLREAGAIRDFRSASNFVWSADLQARNRRALGAIPDLVTRVRDGFAAAGFRPEVFEPFARDLADANEPPLVPADFRGTAMERMLAPLVLRMDDRTATITQISKPGDEAAVREAVLQVPGAHYFVQRDFVNDMYAQFRDSTFRELLVGWLLVVGVLVLRYRRWRPTLAAFLPSALVPVIVLSGLALAEVPINLLHIMSLMMVSGMGVDYGIFVVDGGVDRAEVRTTFISLLLCCLTTVSGFGVLAISSHPALRAMGVTIGSGVLLSLILSPVSLLVMGRRATADDSGAIR